MALAKNVVVFNAAMDPESKFSRYSFVQLVRCNPVLWDVSFFGSDNVGNNVASRQDTPEIAKVSIGPFFSEWVGFQRPAVVSPNLSSGRLATVVHIYRALNPAALAVNFDDNFSRTEVGTQFPPMRTSGPDKCGGGYEQAYQNQEAADSRYQETSPRYNYDLLGRFRHRLLGSEVPLLTLSGGQLALVGALSFFSGLDYANR